MSRKSIVSLVIALLLAAVPASALAFGHGGHEGPGGEIKIFKLLFSDEQNKKLEAIEAPAKQEIHPLIKQMMEQRHELRAMIKNEAVKDEAIKAQINKISETAYALVLKKATIVRAARKIATPEQLAKVDALEAKHEEHMKKFMDMMEKMHDEE